MPAAPPSSVTAPAVRESGRRHRFSLSVWHVLFLALVATIVVVTGAMFVLGEVHGYRTERQLAAAVADDLQMRADSEVAQLLDPLERQVRTDLDRVRLGQLPRFDTEQLKQQLLPSTRRLRGVESMMVGDQSGYQLLLMRWSPTVAASPLLRAVPDLPPAGPHESRYFTRDFRLADRGQRSDWTLWDERGERAVATWSVDLPDYDPRQRPWHQLAIASLQQAERDGGGGDPPIAWTRVYTLFTTKRPGVSVSAAARCPDGSATIVAYDLLLDDLCAFVAALVPATRSRVLLCTGDGAVLATSARAGGDGHAPTALAEPADPVDREWFEQWRNRGGVQRSTAPFRADGEQWWGSWGALRLGGDETLWLGIAVPGGELVAGLGSLSSGYVVYVLLAFVAALVLATGCAWRISRPLQQVVELSRRIGSLELHDTSAPRSRIVELQQLIASLVAARTALREHIAARDAAADALARGEARLQQAQRLEAVGRLAGGIAHDFNNLLTGMLGNVTSARERMALVPDAIAELDAVEHGINSAAMLVRQLLTFARRDRPEPQVVDVAARVLRAQPLLRRMLREEVRFALTVEPGAHPVRIDPTQLEQVVVNLVANANDAIRGVGSVRIGIGRGEGDTVRIAVADDGVGMSEDVQRHAFEPFFTTKHVGEGTGIGLATCYAIVAQAGGVITIDSRSGGGTTVTILLPRSSGAVAATVRPTAPPAAGRGEVVLCIEDDAAIRAVVTRALAANGYTVLQAVDGQAGLDVAACAPHIDLLLTDVVMPRMNGGELAERLLRQRPGLRVLFVSGYAQDVLDDRIPAGAGLLTKPYTPRELLQRVREVLDAPRVSASA